MEKGRVSTGIADLDKLLGGGLPNRYLILIAGGPGAGKTVFSFRYIYDGAKRFGEPGVYVCFAETKDILLDSMEGFGWKLTPDVADKVVVLDLSTQLEVGIQETLNRILETVVSAKARRLVIDSFTAMSMAMRDRIEARYLMHLVYKFLKKAYCTTLVVVDIPWGESRIGSGSEEFIADGVILMENFFDSDGRLRRRLRILKLRGVNHGHDTVQYEIKKSGIKLMR